MIDYPTNNKLNFVLSTSIDLEELVNLFELNKVKIHYRLKHNTIYRLVLLKEEIILDVPNSNIYYTITNINTFVNYFSAIKDTDTTTPMYIMNGDDGTGDSEIGKFHFDKEPEEEDFPQTKAYISKFLYDAVELIILSDERFNWTLITEKSIENITLTDVE
jgi:hypothetical protein